MDTKTDEELIIQLEKRGAEIIYLKEPKRESLQKLWDEPCDILFFAGHSWLMQLPKSIFVLLS